MIRKVIQIDADKCNGCDLCAEACHEGAIGMVDGKATLLRDDYCDGLGDCLPVCPTDAIAFVEREALAYNEAEVNRNKAQTQEWRRGGCPDTAAKTLARDGVAVGGIESEDHQAPEILPCGCPGTHAKALARSEHPTPAQQTTTTLASHLNQWPVQIKLVPTNAPYFDGAKLLIAADCAAYAHANFHEDFIKGKITLIGCPKLDEGDYTEKLTAILAQNDIKSVTVVRMEVPCCGGIENAVKRALQNCGKLIQWQVVTIAMDGAIVE